MADREVKINSINDLKQKLDIEGLETRGMELSKPFSMTQKELEEMRDDFKAINKENIDGKVKKLQEIIEAKKAIHEEAKAERGGEYTLERIKKEIKEKGMSFELTKEILENIDKIPAKNKPFVLGGIFSGLNQIGIGINGINEKGEIIFNTPEKPFNQEGKIANYEETIKYKNLINSCISSGKISISDITKALLYRTTSIDDYINEQVDKNFSTSKYVERLLEKYKIHGGIKGIKVMVQSEQGLKDLKKIINDAITDNQADKEFLLIYIDDLYYIKDSSLDEGEITTYNNISDKNQKAVLKELNNLNEEQRFALGVRDSNEATQVAKEATKDPVGFMKKSLNANNFTVALMTGLLGGILSALFGKGFGKGFLGGAILGFAGAAGGVDFLKGQLDKHGKKGEGESKEGEEKASDKKTNSLFETYKGVLTSQNEDKKLTESEVLIKWDELSKNDKFLSAPASFFDIFETQKDEAKLKEEFKKYGVELTAENKKYYEYIFRELLLAKKRAVGEFNEGETIKSYLERTSKYVVVGGNTGSEKAEGGKSEKAKELSENEKKAILDYFGIKESEVKDLMKNLEVLGLDLFQLLNGYKNFIETKLVGLDENILSKIKEAIKRKTLLINSKIDELKTKEMNKYESLDNFKNNRWIVNNEIKELFEKINFQILPSAFVLVKSQTLSQPKDAYSREKFKRINDMFDSDLTSDGDFDKTFFSTGEIWDSARNNWEVFDMTDEKDFKYLQETWSFDGNEIGKINLLNEKDNEIEEKAMMWYMAGCAVLIVNAGASFTGVWTIPGMVIGSGYSAIDAFKDEDFLISILKSSGAIPEEYRTDKKFIDNILAGIGAIPLLGPALRSISLTDKIAAFTSKLSPERLAKFEAMKAEMFEKLAEKLPKIFKSTQITDDFGNLTTGKQVTITDDFGNLISRGTPNKINKAKEVVNGVFENRFIGNVVDKLEDGKNIEIGGVTFTKTKGMYNGTVNGKSMEFSKNQFLTHIHSLDVAEKQKFIVGIKEAKILGTEIGKVRKIDNHTVEIVSGGKWKIKHNDGTVLDEMQTKAFVEKNLDTLSKDFKGMSISEGGIKLKEGIETGYEKYGIKTVWDYLEKAGFKDGDKSKLFGEGSKPIDALGGIVLTPATTIRQLLDAIPKGEWENIFKILISGNKNIKVWGGVGDSKGVGDFFSKIAFESGIVRAGVIGYGVTQLDDLTGIDKNNGTGDEIGDYAFYRYGGIINTLILKALNK